MKRMAFLLLPLAAGACSDGVAPADGGSSRRLDSTIVVPTVPVASETAIPPQTGVHDTFIRDGIVFVCAWNTGLMLYDVGNGIRGGSPANPVLISQVVTAANASGLATSNGGVAGGPAAHNAWWFHNPNGEKRYVFVGQEGPASVGTFSSGDIHVIDVSNLSAPQEVAYYHMTSTPVAGTHNFWMDEPAQILYAAYYNGGVLALNVSGVLAGNLAAREIARYKPASNSFVWGVQLSEGSLYATDMANGLYQLRLSGNTFSTAGGGPNVPERFSADLWVRGRYAYTGTWGSGSGGRAVGNALKIWNLSATGAPTLADSLIISGIGTVSDVKGSDDGKMLVLSTENGGWAGLYVFSLADPVRPALVARARVAQGLHTAKIADINGRRYVFAARYPATPGSSAAMVIYDVTGLVS